MMSPERRKALAADFLQRTNTGDLDLETMTQGFTCWSPFMELPRDQFVGLLDKFRSVFKPGFRLEITGMTVEGERVAVEARSFGETVDGKAYRNTYHFLLQFEGERISAMREYCDTQHVAETLLPLLS